MIEVPYSEFLDQLINKHDEIVIQDIRPADSWKVVKSTWWNRRELVRKIAEGLGISIDDLIK